MPQVTGEPTEKAIVEEYINMGTVKDKLENFMPRINEIPFDSNRKMMTTIHKIGNKYRIITKGAPDVIFKRCKYALKYDEVIEISDEILDYYKNVQNK